MSTTGVPTPPPTSSPPGQAPRRLVRLTDQGKVAGVAAGFGWYAGIDPTLVRIGLVVLTITTGLGIPIYAIAWLLMPATTTHQTPLSAPSRPRDGRSLLIAAVAIIAVTGLLGQIDIFGGRTVLAAILIGLGILLFSDDKPGLRPSSANSNDGGRATRDWYAAPPVPPVPPHGATPPHGQTPPHGATPPHTPTPPASATPPHTPASPHNPNQPHGSSQPHSPNQGHGPNQPHSPNQGHSPNQPHGPNQPHSAYEPYSAAWTRPPRHRPGPARRTRPRSYLGRLTFGIWILSVSTAVMLSSLGVLSLDARTFFGITIGVAGLGLLAGTFFGRARGLIVVGTVASVFLMLATLNNTTNLAAGNGVGEQQQTVTDLDDLRSNYDWSIGESRLDLGGLDLDGEDATVSAGIIAGEVQVTVPDDVTVFVDGALGVGEARILGEQYEGTNLEIDVDGEVAEADGVLRLEINGLIGDISVVRQGSGVLSDPVTPGRPGPVDADDGPR